MFNASLIVPVSTWSEKEVWGDTVLNRKLSQQYQDALLRELDGRGHFYTVLISFRGRALYKDIEKYSNLKLKFIKFFFTKWWFIALQIMPKTLK